MQQFKPLVGLGAVHGDLLADQRQLGRGVLTDCIQRDLGTFEMEGQHRGHPLKPFQQALSEQPG